jgi:phenylpropionate dioxygenase-like ring-hydroxylating dioxygenase large terminal subunit
MIPIKIAQAADPVEALLEVGLKDLWYPICPSGFVQEKPISVRRLGRKIALWRDSAGTLHALEDRCPHRGAPLSQGVVLGDRLACPYHGVEVRCDGTVTKVPGSPGCKLEGSRPTLSFHVQERHGAVFLFNSDENVEAPPPLELPEELESPEYSHFLCYTEWRGDYRYVMDNVMDPMHGTFLHKQSHSMAEGENTAQFQIRPTDMGFVFEKTGQKGVNFDWTEWASTNIHWMRLAIPIPEDRRPRRQLQHRRQLHAHRREHVGRVLLAQPQADRLAARHVALPVPQPPGGAPLARAGAGPRDAGGHGTRCQPARAPVPA